MYLWTCKSKTGTDRASHHTPVTTSITPSILPTAWSVLKRLFTPCIGLQGASRHFQVCGPHVVVLTLESRDWVGLWYPFADGDHEHPEVSTSYSGSCLSGRVWPTELTSPQSSPKEPSSLLSEVLVKAQRFSFQISLRNTAQGANHLRSVGTWGLTDFSVAGVSSRVNMGEKIPSAQFVFWVKIEAVKCLVLNISLKKWVDIQGYVYLFGVGVDRVQCFIGIGLLPKKR